MKRYFAIIMVIALVISMTACGGGSTMESAPSEGSATDGQAAADREQEEMAKAGEYEGAMNEASSDSGYGDELAPGSGTVVYTGGFATDLDKKIIYSGDISLETEKFDETMAKIDMKIKETGSYIESSSISGTGKSEYDLRYASLVVRVPAGKFDYLKKAAEEWGTVISSNTSSQDVTKQYIDTEARIKTLKIQEERLLALLGKAEKLEDIIVLEGRLSDIRLQIESYTGTLQELDAYVDYATIGISIREVKSETYIPQNFGQRLMEAVRDSLKQLGQTLENMVVALIYLTPYIILLIVLVLVVKRTGAVGRLLGQRHKKGNDGNPLDKK